MRTTLPPCRVERRNFYGQEVDGQEVSTWAKPGQLARGGRTVAGADVRRGTHGGLGEAERQLT